MTVGMISNNNNRFSSLFSSMGDPTRHTIPVSYTHLTLPTIYSV